MWQKRHHKYIPISFLAVNDYVISCVYVFVVVHVTFSVVHARCSSTCAEAHDVMLASALKDCGRLLDLVRGVRCGRPLSKTGSALRPSLGLGGSALRPSLGAQQWSCGSAACLHDVLSVFRYVHVLAP